MPKALVMYKMYSIKIKLLNLIIDMKLKVMK